MTEHVIVVAALGVVLGLSKRHIFALGFCVFLIAIGTALTAASPGAWFATFVIDLAVIQLAYVLAALLPVLWRDRQIARTRSTSCESDERLG